MILKELEETWRYLCGEGARSEVDLADVEQSIHRNEEALSAAKSHVQAANRVIAVIARRTKESQLIAEIEVLG